MADVTISSLPQGTPSGNHLLPYSTGSNTLGVPVSAIFQNVTSNVGIGYSNLLSKVSIGVDDGTTAISLRNNQNGGLWNVFIQGSASSANNFYLNNTNKDTGLAGNVLTIRGTSGQIGIGTTNPSAALDVNGDVKALSLSESNPCFIYGSPNRQGGTGGFATSFYTRQSYGGLAWTGNGITVPKSGFYLINLNMLSSQTTNRVDTGIYVNGDNHVLLLAGYTSTSEYKNTIGNIVLGLNVGDIVNVQTTNWYNNTVDNDNWRTMSIYKVG